METPNTHSLLQELSNAHGVPGFEDEVRAIFRRELAQSGEASVDRMGNFFLKRTSARAPHIVVDSHMDEVGFLVQSITPDGFLRVVGLGGWNPATLPAQPVVVITSKGKVPGIFGSIPPHFLKGNSNTPEMDSLYVDVGASSEAMARSWGIRKGLAICPDIVCRPSAHPERIIGKAFDNRAGCSACIEVAKMTLGMDLQTTFVGSVQEELGLRGANVVGQSLRADLALVLEGTPADDAPGHYASSSQSVLGRGVQIRCFDPTHLANFRLVEWAIEVAEQHSIPYQLAVRRNGGTNAGRYHLDPSGVPTVVLGVPTRYIHSHSSLLDLGDYKAMRDLCSALLTTTTKEVYESLLPH
jgi:putative aminopeptidase FrvX